jgi:histidine phosphotransfer protein HptB
MSEEPILDSQAIEGLRALSPDDGPEFLRELIEIFLKDTPERVTELTHALAQNDAVTFTRAAHTIKGSSSNFGAARLAKAAHDLEMQGKTGDLTSTGAACEKLKNEYALVAQALTEVAQAT